MTEGKMPVTWTDAQVEAACQKLEQAVNAAYNSNHAGEQFVIAAAAAHALLEALERAQTYIFDEAERRDFDPPIPSELVAEIAAALAAAKGAA